MKVLRWIVLATALVGTVVGCRKAELPDFVTAEEKNTMETFQLLPIYGKGGVGVIYDPLYVFTRTKRNEIDWRDGDNQEKWIGQKGWKPEVVVFYDGKVWPPQSLPHGFDKSKSVVFLFDEKKICVYDYVHHEGGFYERYPPEERHDN